MSTPPNQSEHLQSRSPSHTPNETPGAAEEPGTTEDRGSRHRCGCALIGMKHCGKTTVGRLLAEHMGTPFWDLDDLIRQCYAQQFGLETAPSVRTIFRRHGKPGFHEYERAAVAEFERRLADSADCGVLASGGGVVENTPAVERLAARCVVVYLDEAPEVLFERVVAGGIPPFLESSDPRTAFLQLWSSRDRLYRRYADHVLVQNARPPEEIAAAVYDLIQEYTDAR